MTFSLTDKTNALLAIVLIIIFGTFFAFALDGEDEKEKEPQQIGVADENAEWTIVGDDEVFTGYHTKSDPSKVAMAANPQGQNTVINDGDRISIRKEGYELFPESGTLATSTENIKSMHTFRRRDGENILMRTYSDKLEYFDESGNQWEVLRDGYTTGTEFGFADYNINTDQTSFVYFGNAHEDFSKWTGVKTNLTQDVKTGTTTIHVEDGVTGWKTSGSLVFCGTEHDYSARSSNTMTLSTSAKVDCSSGRAVAEAVSTSSTLPKGNKYMVANNRLFISGLTSTPQIVAFSEYGNADNFNINLVSDSTAADPGAFNLAEGGGAVTAMVQDESSLYFFKKSIIYKATLDDTLYTLNALKPFDGKSQTVGAVSKNSVFAGGNGIFFITPDNQIMNLTRVENVDHPQIVPISDKIKPTTDAGNFASSSGIFYRDKAYFSFQANDDSSVNDTVLVYNQSEQQWESPVVGWNASVWSIYNDGSGDKLFFGDSNTNNTYQVTPGAQDGKFGLTANWRSKLYDFGLPHQQKSISNVFVEGYIAENTDLEISLLLDEDGFTQSYNTTLDGANDQYIFDATEYNRFGLSPFGSERFGSNDDFSNLRPFRIYLNKDFRKVPFYRAQLEFASDGDNQSWEVLRYGFKVEPESRPLDRNLYKSFQ